MTKVSVIIPCYNQGEFLEEAVNSVMHQSFQDFEIIIVNDGSTDSYTIDLCQTLKHPSITVITTSNQGLAAARNNGIERANGEYILPLDADDRIGSGYLAAAAAVLDKDSEVGIVYCKAKLFGAVEAEWLLPEYSLSEMLKDNVIFCTAMFRRKDWQDAGGYDTGMVFGWEDYDFWLSLIERGRRVVQLPRTYFYYRVASNSMVRSKEKWQKIAMFKRIYERHTELIGSNIEVWLADIVEVRERYQTCQLFIDSGNGFQEEQSIKQKVSLGLNRFVFDVSDMNGIQAIRFDPADCPVHLSLEEIRLGPEEPHSLADTVGVRNNAELERGDEYWFSTRDPQFSIPLSSVTAIQLQTISIALNIKSMGQQALLDVIAGQRKLLEKRGARSTGERPFGKLTGFLSGLK